MVAVFGVPRLAFVPVMRKNPLVAAGIVGPWEEVLVMVVAFAGVDVVYASQPVSPLTPDVSRCCLLLAAAVATASGEDLGEIASSAAGNWCLEVPYTVAAGSPLCPCPAVVVAVGKEGAPSVVADLADDNVGPDGSTASSLVGIF